MHRPRAILPILVAVALSGCAGKPTLDATAPHPILPPAPADFGKAVAVPHPRPGDDVRVYAGKVRAALAKANRRLTDDGAFYTDAQGGLSAYP